MTFSDVDGTSRSLLRDEEVRWLSLRKGSLSERERQQIESHVLHTYRFLQQIPWTREIRRIPAIALGHHEKLNGSAYPHKLSAQDTASSTLTSSIYLLRRACTIAGSSNRMLIRSPQGLEASTGIRG